MSQFSDRIINLRESHDWSKTYVANHLGLKNMQTYANWEYGKSEPDNEMLTKIANLFDVSTDYLLGNTDKRHYYDLTSKDKKGIDKQIEDMMSGVSDNSLAYFQNGAELDDDDKKLLEASLRQVLETSRVLAKKKFTPKKYRDTDDE